ncbi:ribosomal subunit interface protein, partial [Bacillus sp. MBGLi97]
YVVIDLLIDKLDCQVVKYMERLQMHVYDPIKL